MPSFALPPSDISNLRILHASCRKPHGKGLDMFGAMDGMLATSHTNANTRPHQLYLTGDQIYADDVDTFMLTSIRHWAKELVVWEEKMPGLKEGFERGFGEPQFPIMPEQVPNDHFFLNPGKREFLAGPATSKLRVGIGNDKKALGNHLLELSDFYMMYMLAWSPVLWPLLPDGDNLSPFIAAFKREFGEDVLLIKSYWDSLPSVRRALANIPTYMMFDDHEITDDWYLSKGWCKEVLTDGPQSLGVRLIANGLTAFALFQAWGNNPVMFESVNPGYELLQVLKDRPSGLDAENYAYDSPITSGETGYPNNWKLIQKLVGVPEFAAVESASGLPEDPDAIVWSFSIEFPQFVTMVLDTRTHRSFREGSWEDEDELELPAALFGASQKQVQVPGGNKELNVYPLLCH